MKKITLFIFSFVCLVYTGFSQTWSNAFTIEKLGASKVFHDNNGFIYSLGYDWDTCAGNTYGYGIGLTLYKIQKIDPATGLKIWEKRILSSTFFRVANAVFINNRIYIGGKFQSDISYNSQYIFSNGGFDICYITVSTGGNIIIKTEGSSGDEEADGFDVDENGNIYFTGRVTGQIVLGTRSYNTLGQTDFYIMKKDSLYNEVWTKIGKTVPGYNPGWGRSVIKQNNYFYSTIAGRSVMEFTTDTIGCGDNCDFILKFDLNGNFISAFPNIASNQGGSSTLSFNDSLDNLYYFSCYPGHYSSYSILNKVSSADSLIWRQSFDTCSNYYLNYIANVIKKSNNYYLAGTGYNPISYNPYYYLIKGNLSTGDKEQFIAISDHQGYGDGALITEYINNDFLYFGLFKDTIEFGTQALISPNSLMGFVAILDWNGLASVHNYEVIADKIDIYPNPSSGIFTVRMDICQAGAKITVRDVLGNCLLERSCRGETSQEINLSCQPRGIYFVELLSGKNRVVKKVAVQ